MKKVNKSIQNTEIILDKNFTKDFEKDQNYKKQKKRMKIAVVPYVDALWTKINT